MNLNEIILIIETKTGYRARSSGNGYSTKCPCAGHSDTKPSFSVSQSDDGTILMYCHAGCTFETICEELGIAPSELFLKDNKLNLIDCHFVYYDEQGKPLYRKIKAPNKKFSFERFENGDWIPGLKNCRRVLYNLPEITEAIKENRSIAIVEGEKDVETLRRLGYVATTNDTGAGKNKWKKNHSLFLKNAHALLFYDYDQAGIDHRDQIINQLNGYVASLRLVNLPGYEVVSKDGRDISDWIKEGHTYADLKKIIEDAELIQNHSIMNEKNNNKPLDSRVRAVSIEDLLQMKIDPPEYFLEPFLSKSSLGMIYASSGIGKTFFALNLAFALSSGGHFMKFRAPKPCKVLYLDGEMSIYSMKDRIEKIYFSSEVKPIKNHFKLVNSFLQDSPLPNMWSVAEQKKLDELIDSADVVIVDNLSCWVRSGIENDGEDWLPLLEWALKLRHRGKSVIFIHHSNKSKSGQRGTSRREDALDYIIKLERPKRYRNKDGACFIMSFEKNRSLYGTDVESLDIKLVNLPDGKYAWEWSVYENQQDGEGQEQISEIKRLKSLGNTHEKIAEQLGISKATVSRKLKLP